MNCFFDPNNLVYVCPSSSSGGGSVDTVYIERCSDTTSFYDDFNSAVNNQAMSIFLASVMAGILAVRAVIKIIKGAVR